MSNLEGSVLPIFQYFRIRWVDICGTHDRDPSIRQANFCHPFDPHSVNNCDSLFEREFVVAMGQNILTDVGISF